MAITVKDGPYGPYGPAVKVLHGKPVGTKGEWLCPICGTTNAKRYYVCGKCGKGLSP